VPGAARLSACSCEALLSEGENSYVGGYQIHVFSTRFVDEQFPDFENTV